MERKKLPIGLSDFKELLEDNYYYADKSLFIKDIIDSGAKSVLLPRPRRFGKTLNLSMLHYFYERSETDHRHLFNHLAISREESTYMAKQGAHPVIFLTFKDVKCANWEECEQLLKRAVSDEYRRHHYLLETSTLKSYEKEEFMNIMRLKADKTAFQQSIKQLSAYLHRYHETKTVILIDEYDTPIHSGYIYGYNDQVIAFMRNLLSGGLKDNTDLEKGVLTGILRLAKESIFSGLNNLQVCSLLQSEYSHYFGFLEHEVEALFHSFEVGCDIHEVKEWYNGYVFGDNVIYNPWSLINFTAQWRNGLQPYWLHTSSNDLVKQMITISSPTVKKEIETLIDGKSIKKTVDDHIVLEDLPKSPEALWSFLLMSGYLKSEEKTLHNGYFQATLRIPNEEVNILFHQIILSWFKNSIHSESYETLLQSLTEGDMETFEPLFCDFVVKSFSFFDTAGQDSENVYHAFVLGALIGLQDTHEIRSNRESGFGRYDVMIIPKNRAHKGIILEFKKTNDQRKESLKKAADAALAQIEKKQYEQELTAVGIRDVLKIGIAFAGKTIRMRTT